MSRWALASIPMEGVADSTEMTEIEDITPLAVLAQLAPIAEGSETISSSRGGVAISGSRGAREGQGESSDARGWKRRAPESRRVCADRESAMESALRGFSSQETDAIICPVEGTSFDSIGEAYDFYNLYSWETGFGIRYGKRRTNPQGSKTMQEVVCGCSGKPRRANSTSCRCECPALIRLLRSSDNGWYVAVYRPSHNHALSQSLGKKAHWPSHKHIDPYTKDLVKQLRANNVNLARVYSIIGSLFGKMENVPFTKRALRNLCGQLGRDQADDDVGKTMDYFAELSAADPEFTYTVKLDSESRVEALFWTNGSSKMKYQWFGDVITFDTTYRTKLYDMPFGLFMGVNNHFQSIILGGVLVRRETTESFVWVFREFLRLMGGNPLMTILTDQAQAMKSAIAVVFPTTVHRWCKWHVLRKAKECLGAHYRKDSGFRTEFHKLVGSMMDTAEFEKAWQELMSKYKLCGNKFLLQAYDTRELWAKPYFKGQFCANQTSTQRSESANHMLKNYVPPGCPINVFLRQYQKLLFDRDSEESFQEKRSSLAGVVLKSNLQLEIHASKVYTRTMFEKFGEIIYQSGRYRVDEVVQRREYKVTHVNADKRERWAKSVFMVSFKGDFEELRCECGEFEHTGILCCHSVKVMINLDIPVIPAKNIVKRWTLQARDILPGNLAYYQKDKGAPAMQTQRHARLFKQALELVTLGDCNADSFNVAMKMMQEAKEKLVEFGGVKDGVGLAERAASSAERRMWSGKCMPPKAAASAPSVGLIDCHEEGSESFSAPPASHYLLGAPLTKKQARGRPTTARSKPPYEQKDIRRKCCTICTEAGHTRLTCPQRGDAPKIPRKPGKCSRCGVPGHRMNNCLVPFDKNV